MANETNRPSKLKTARLLAGMTLNDVQAKLRDADVGPWGKSSIQRWENDEAEPPLAVLQVLRRLYGAKL